MADLAFVGRHRPTSDGATEMGILGPITNATTPVLRDTLRRIIDDGLLARTVAQQAARVRGADLYPVDVPALIAHQLGDHSFDTLLLDP